MSSLSYFAQPSSSGSTRSANRSSATESILQRISKRASLPHRALSRTRSLLHRSSTSSNEQTSKLKTKYANDGAEEPSARSNSTAIRGSWHGLFEFERLGAQKFAPELCISTSFDRWPKLHSLDGLRRESDDSGYESLQSSQITHSKPPTERNKIYCVERPNRQRIETARNDLTPAVRIRDVSTQSFPNSDLAQISKRTKNSTTSSSNPLDDTIHTPLPHYDDPDECPDLETSSTYSDLSCTVDELLETDWPNLGIEYATEEMFLARKDAVALTLNVPVIQHHREAWWTCEVVEPARQVCGERFAAFRRSLHF